MMATYQAKTPKILGAPNPIISKSKSRSFNSAFKKPIMHHEPILSSKADQPNSRVPIDAAIRAMDLEKKQKPSILAAAWTLIGIILNPNKNRSGEHMFDFRRTAVATQLACRIEPDCTQIDSFAKRTVFQIFNLVTQDTGFEEQYWLIDAAKLIFGKNKTAEALPSILASPSPYIVDDSRRIKALARFGKPAIPVFLGVLENNNAATAASWLAVNALAALKEQSAIPLLEKMLDRSGSFHEITAIEAIGTIGGNSAAQILSRELQASESSESQRLTALLSALSRAGGPSVGPIVLDKYLETYKLAEFPSTGVMLLCGLGMGVQLMAVARKEILTSSAEERFALMKFIDIVSRQMKSCGALGNQQFVSVNFSKLGLSRSLSSHIPTATYSIGEPKQEIEVCLT